MRQILKWRATVRTAAEAGWELAASLCRTLTATGLRLLSDVDTSDGFNQRPDRRQALHCLAWLRLEGPPRTMHTGLSPRW
jgi:hypothetical protein